VKPKPVYSPTIDGALALAATAHREQKRKGSDVPYIQHPVHVAMILMAHGFPEHVVVAGLLHDVVEDTDVGMDAIAARFGAKVAALVATVTEQKTSTGRRPRRLPWRERKEHQLAHLARATAEGAALKAADALHNCHSTLADLAASGPRAWERFNAGPDEQRWYYGEISRAVRSRLGDHPLALELEATVRALHDAPEPPKRRARSRK
jgi:(p)ppGpp synthase/HD superfamily hydrolase